MPANGYRGAPSDLGDALAGHETGLLITVDEMQSGDVEEIREWRIRRMVFAPTWRTLSEVNRRFLPATAQDDAESKFIDDADLSHRLLLTIGFIDSANALPASPSLQSDLALPVSSRPVRLAAPVVLQRAQLDHGPTRQSNLHENEHP